MSVVLVAIVLVVMFFGIRAALKNTRQTVTGSRKGNSKRYFPAEGLHALLEEKYSDSGGNGYRVCFLDDDGDWWNVKVPPAVYDALETDSYELLRLDAGGELFIAFGEIRDEGVDITEALPELSMELDFAPEEGEADPEMLAESEWDELEAFWEEPLPMQKVELRAQTPDLRALDPATLLAAAGLPRYMLMDGYVKELAAEVYAAVREELSGYEGYPRQAEAGNLLEHRGNTFHLYLTIVENQPPLDSVVEGTLSINDIGW